jgi:hypothetical protein
MLRVHDVREVADFLAVRGVLRGERAVPEELLLARELRHERPGRQRAGRAGTRPAPLDPAARAGGGGR